MRLKALLIGSFALTMLTMVNVMVAPAAGQEVKYSVEFQVDNEPVRCADGYAAKGIACKDPSCQEIGIICSQYHPSYDSEARSAWSAWFPAQDARDVSDTSGFVAGLIKSDTLIRVDILKTPHLLNEKKCFWKSFENATQKICSKGTHLSGLGYKDEEFKIIQLYCCRSKIPIETEIDAAHQSN